MKLLRKAKMPNYAELGFATFLQHQALSGTEGVMKTAQMCKEIFEELGDRTGSFTVGPREAKNCTKRSKHVQSCPCLPCKHGKMMEHDGK